MNRAETLAELKRLRDTGGTVGPWLLRDAIAVLEDAEQQVDTYKRASSYWYVKCQMDRGHTVDPYSSSQHNDEIVRQMVAERQRVDELEREVGRARERCECGAFNPDPVPEAKQPCGCEFVGVRLVPCPRHVIFGRLPAVRFTDGTIHHYDEHGNCYAESGPKPC